MPISLHFYFNHQGNRSIRPTTITLAQRRKKVMEHLSGQQVYQIKKALRQTTSNADLRQVAREQADKYGVRLSTVALLFNEIRTRSD